MQLSLLCPSQGTSLTCWQNLRVCLKIVFLAVTEWGARPVQMSQLPDSLSQTIGHKRQHHKGLNPSALISPSLFLGLLVNLCCSYLTETTTACCISSNQASHSQVLVSLCELSAVQLDKRHFYHSLLHRWDMTGTLWMHHQAFMATTALPS